MIALETIGVAFAMFSALPVPKIEWNERNMRYAMAAFPLIGAVIGAIWCVCGLIPLPEMVKAAGFCLIPVAVQTAKDVIELQGFREFHVGVLPKWQAGGFLPKNPGLYQEKDRVSEQMRHPELDETRGE